MLISGMTCMVSFQLLVVAACAAIQHPDLGVRRSETILAAKEPRGLDREGDLLLNNLFNAHTQQTNSYIYLRRLFTYSS